MNQPRTLKTVTLGCKVNQYETEFVRQGFERLGYRKASEAEPVDLCIVNTCTVTAESEAKCRKIIRRLAKRIPQAEIIVLGCFAARAPADAAAARRGRGARRQARPAQSTRPARIRRTCPPASDASTVVAGLW